MIDELLRNCQIAAFDDIEFPATESEQSGGRRVTVHEAWRRAGSENVDGGRKSYQGSLTAMMLNGFTGWGDLFPEKAAALILRFETGADGELRHPLLGNFTATITDWKPRLDPRIRNGIALDFSWIEQRASTVGLVGADPGTPRSDARADMVFRADEADAAVAKTGATGTAPIAAPAREAVTALAGNPSYGDIGARLGAVSTATDTNIAAVARVPQTSTNGVTLHLARASLLGVRVAVDRMRATLLPDPLREQFVVVDREMTFAELSQERYGSPGRARDIRAANAIATDLILPGTRVRILP